MAGLFGAGLGVSAAESSAAAEPHAGADAAKPRWKGRGDSKVKRWDVITIGNLSRNRYWGESSDRAYRAAICTCTVIAGEGFRVLVDPSLAKADEMARELDRRTGLKIADINTVFITHEHGDHVAGLAHFADARWVAAPDVAAKLNVPKKLAKPVEGATGRLHDALEIIATPGHTMSHHSLRFDCDGRSIIAAGDAVATRDFWNERMGYFNAVDFALSAKTMNRMAEIADVIVPGHDNYFLV
jgi:glyoxylase-like metal-dependent hydrolase (beta-lactamase superfamily II)